MHALLLPPDLLGTANGGAGYLVWVLASGLTAVVAVIRVLRQPPETWAHRNWSLLAWVFAALYLAPSLGGYPIPAGAITAIWRTRRRPPAPAPPGQLPPAEGSADSPLPWEPK